MLEDNMKIRKQSHFTQAASLESIMVQLFILLPLKSEQTGRDDSMRVSSGGQSLITTSPESPNDTVPVA
jgi:hypothetical protein